MVAEMMRRLLSLVLVLTVAYAGCSHRVIGLQMGDRVPPTTLTDLHGQWVTIPEDIKGKVALVRFWSIDCSLCKNEMILSLDALCQKYRESGCVSISIYEGRLTETDERFNRFYHVTYPVLFDEYGTGAENFGVVVLPTTFILDEEGIVRERITGEPGIDTLEKFMTGVLYKEGFYDSVY
jgi:cytochrome c biogenesis protein CcmG, thiol:disulfide interchange protein DsbE